MDIYLLQANITHISSCRKIQNTNNIWLISTYSRGSLERGNVSDIYYIQQCNDKNRTCTRFKLTIDTTYIALTGELLLVDCVDILNHVEIVPHRILQSVVEKL